MGRSVGKELPMSHSWTMDAVFLCSSDSTDVQDEPRVNHEMICELGSRRVEYRSCAHGNDSTTGLFRASVSRKRTEFGSAPG